MKDYIKREPVRAYIGTVLAVLVGALVLFGILTGEQAAYVVAALPALLGVPAIAAARSQVYPSVKVESGELLPDDWATLDDAHPEDRPAVFGESEHR